ncbi:MAG: uracil-DNA glycosylase [bacterium]
MNGTELKQLLEDIESFIFDNKEYFTVMSAVEGKKSSLPAPPVCAGKTAQVCAGNDVESSGNRAGKAAANFTGSKTAMLKSLKEESVNDCVKCKLSKTRKNIVFGEGSPESSLMFIGEAPGAEEDNTGRPFVGKAGQLLTKIIESINLKREDVYIANIIKCRPPENRNPMEDEIAACASFLKEQISVIKPKIICTLGKFSTEFIIGEGKGAISSVRGKEFDYEGITVIPTYHPSYLLRNPGAKKETWEDMKKIRDLYFKN